MVLHAMLRENSPLHFLARLLEKLINCKENSSHCKRKNADSRYMKIVFVYRLHILC